MKAVPSGLLEHIQQIAKQIVPTEVEVIALDWPYEDEDYNIAVVVPDTTSYEEARQLEDRLIDAMIDYDKMYSTFTVCMVWRQQEKALARMG
jgi:hypothetical protein